MVIKYPNCQSNIPNGHKIYQHFPIYGPPKFTQIVIFGFENKPSGNPAQQLHWKQIGEQDIAVAARTLS
jgi:hypothetical protein